jgi:hypothetical protein
MKRETCLTNFFAVDGNDCKIASDYLERCDQKGHTDLTPPSFNVQIQTKQRTFDILATCDKRQRKNLKREFHALMDHVRYTDGRQNYLTKHNRVHRAQYMFHSISTT